MKRLVLIVLAVMSVGVVTGAVLVAQRTTPKSGVAIIGDSAPGLLDATGLDQALPLHTAGLTVVSVETWDKLRFIGDMHALCGAACGDATGVVRVLRLRPGGSDKVLYLNHAALQGDDPVACLAQVIQAEVTAQLAPKSLPDCAATLDIQRKWNVPGFGTF